MRIAEGILAAAAVVLVGAALWLGQPYHYDYPSCEASGVMEKIADGRHSCGTVDVLEKHPHQLAGRSGYWAPDGDEHHDHIPEVLRRRPGL